MFYELMGRLYAALQMRMKAIEGALEAPRRRGRAEGGQGTVEYVGLILLVSLLMVGMVAAMKGYSGKQGTELAEVIVDKIKQAVGKVTFK